MRLAKFYSITMFFLGALVFPDFANATTINDTTKNVSFYGNASINWFNGWTSSVGDAVQGGPEFDTNRVVVTTSPKTLKLDFITQFDGDDLGAHYPDIFVATNPALPDQFNFAIALGFEAPYGGMPKGLYALSNNYQTSIDRWAGTGYIYGGQYISPNDNLGHKAPVVVTSGSTIPGWTVDVTQGASGDATYPVLLSVTLTALTNQALNSVFTDPSFAVLWGTGDCNNDSVYFTVQTPPNEVPEPPTALLLAGGLLTLGLTSLRGKK